MRFFALVALLGSAAAIKLQQKPVPQVAQIPHFSLSKIEARTKWENLTPEQEKEIEEWVTNELTTGEKTITKQEAHDAIVAFGEKHGFPPIPEEVWAELDKMFDAVDTNDDGAIDLEELQAALS